MKGNACRCEEIRPDLTAYLAGEMEPAREAAVRTHLESCSECRAAARDLAAALDAVRDALAAAGDAPPALDGWRRARIRSARRPGWFCALTDRRVLARAAALILLLGGISSMVLSSGMRTVSRARYRDSSRIEVAMMDAPPVVEQDHRDFDREGETASFGFDRQRESAPPAPAGDLAALGRTMAADRIARPAGPASVRRPAAAAAPEVRSEAADLAMERLPTPDSSLRGEPVPLPRHMAPPPGAVPVEAPLVGGMAEPASSRDQIAALDIRPEPESPLVMRGLFAGRTAPGRRDQLRRHMTDPDGLVDLPADVAPLPVTARPARAADALEAKADVFLEDMVPGGRGSGVALAQETVREEREWRNGDRADVPPRAPADPPVFHVFMDAAEERFSTFSMDVDTASYTLARGHIFGGARPPPDLVRTEEIVNAFDYDYTPPASGAFAIDARLLPSPFRPGLYVLRIGIKARRVGRDQDRRALLTLVVDTSGSMDTPDRLGRIREALPRLVNALSPDDRVALVQFDRSARMLLGPTPAAERERILAAIDGLAVGGGTNLESGLALGYGIAAQHFQAGASNRVMLLTDGVANLGATSAGELLSSVEGFRRQGIYLSVLGFGIGTYDDDLLKTLAQRGDGTYAFIDSDAEAQRVLVDDLAATLHTVAGDAKIQVEFNPDRVVRYRQIGYERRQLAREDFRDDTVDAGEVGSGQSVTALYEIEPAVGRAPASLPRPWATVSIRYRDVETGRVVEQARAVGEEDRVGPFGDAPPRTRLAVMAAEFAEVLRGNPFTAGTTLADVIEQLRPVAEALPLDGQVQEFLDLAETARRQPEW